MAPSFLPPDSHIHIIARAVLLQGERIILCRLKGGDYFFLPGGHVEDGEAVRAALLRELHEEIGPNNYAVGPLIGACENVFPAKDDLIKHEINFVFRVDVPEGAVIASREDHIELISVPQSDLVNYDLRPADLKKALIQWLEDGEPFFEESA